MDGALRSDGLRVEGDRATVAEQAPRSSSRRRCCWLMQFITWVLGPVPFIADASGARASPMASPMRA